MSEWNERVIAEFRANGGAVGGAFEGSHLMLLTTTGAKTGKRRTTPVAFTDEGDTRILVASKAGSSSPPAWYQNVLADPRVHVEASVDDRPDSGPGARANKGIDEYEAMASLYPEEQRETRYREILESLPAFASYWTGDKIIPLVVLTRLP